MEQGSKDQTREWQNGLEQYQSQAPFGFNNSGMMSGFGNGSWGVGGMSPMMAMQNGMPMQGWNGFPNMGKLGLHIII